MGTALEEGFISVFVLHWWLYLVVTLVKQLLKYILRELNKLRFYRRKNKVDFFSPARKNCILTKVPLICSFITTEEN